jgi:hypothetical protein
VIVGPIGDKGVSRIEENKAQDRPTIAAKKGKTKLSMRERGVFIHGPVKTFLTRGFLGKYFRPVLYKSSDHIHLNFIEVLNDEVMAIQENVSEAHKNLVTFWHCLTPIKLFNTLFIKNRSGSTMIPLVLEFAQNTNGAECAYLTQAFCLYMLELFLKNDQSFSNSIGLDITEFEKITTTIYGDSNRTLPHLHNFRKKFDTKKLEFDPGDLAIEYISNICVVLIPDQSVLTRSLCKWDEDILAKTQALSFVTDFFKERKSSSLKTIDNIAGAV